MKNKLRKPRKASNRLKKDKATQNVRQSVNIVVGLPQRSRRRQTTKMGGMRARGEPIMPSSVTASNPPRRNVEINTTNRITEDKLKAIQDEARSEYTQRLLENEKKILAIEQKKTDAQEQKEDRITQLIQEAPRMITEIVDERLQLQSPLQPSPNIKPQRSDAGKKRGPYKPRVNLSTPQKEEKQTIETPQRVEPIRFMDEMLRMVD